MKYLVIAISTALSLQSLPCFGQAVKHDASKVQEGGWSITDDSGTNVFNAPSRPKQVKQEHWMRPIRGQQPVSAHSERSSNEPISRLQEIGVKGVPTSIRAVHILNDNDREMLAHPTMGVRQVIDHYETRTRYVTDGYGNSIPEYYQVPIYRNEEYEVSKEEERQFTTELLDVAKKYDLTQRYQRMISVLKHDGIEIELANGWLVEVLEFSDDGKWFSGANLLVTKHPHLSFPYVVLINERGSVLPGEIVAAI